MSDDLGRSPRAFPTTQWTWVARAGVDGQQGRAALDQLLRMYLPPMKAHLVWKKNVSPERADDLIQGFVARKILEQHLLARADRFRGSRFRSFLLTALDNYASNELHRERGPRAPALGLDLVEDDVAALAGRSEPFDLVWARQIIDETIKRMHAECERKKRPDIWDVFDCRMLRPILENQPPMAYEELVRRLGFRSPVQASLVLATAKRMFQRTMLHVMNEYAGDEDEMEQLMHALSKAGAA